MSEPWEEAVKQIGIKIIAAEQELIAAKKEHATKAELTALRGELKELMDELKAIKAQGSPNKPPKVKDEITPDPIPTPDPNDVCSGFF